MKYLLISLAASLLVPGVIACSKSNFGKRADIVHPPQRDAVVHFSDPSVRGSAFLLQDGRHFITNLHVIFGHVNQIRVSQNGKEPVPATVVQVRDDLDLALFRVNGAALDVSSDPISACKPEAGLAIYAVGAPYGLPGSLLRGNIAHPDRTGLDPFYTKLPMIQTQGITFPGMSGAAVYCEKGGLLGINRAAYGFGLENGFGMIIPATAVDSLLSDAGLMSVFNHQY